MGTTARVDDEGLHVGTGRGDVEPHRPQWGPPTYEHANVWLRQCRHPDCDIDAYANSKDGPWPE